MKCCSLPEDKIVLGYYPLRGKCQICRLLCEYMHLPYKDVYFTPQCWEKFKQMGNTSNWMFTDLPFLKDGDFIATETYPISLYLINKANRKDLLGKTLEDEAKVDIFLWQCQILNQIFSFLIKMKNQPQVIQESAFNKLWEVSLSKKISQYQSQCGENYYLGYLTIVDFHIYDIFYFFSKVKFEKITAFPKLLKVYQTVATLPEISAYQESSKAIKQICPVGFCEQWKQKCGS